MGGNHSNGFGWGSTAEQTARDVNLQGKNVIVTGANTGIGYETARVLAKHGARVILACRNEELASRAVASIKADNGEAKVELLKLDLSSFKSIRSFADEFKKLDIPLNILVNNAGVMACPYMKTEDGFEMQFGTNHLGHFLLTNLLIDDLKKGAPARVVNVSSYAYTFGGIIWDDINSEKSYGRSAAYSQSKTANILFSVELTKRYKGEGITSNALHPGTIATELARHIPLLTGGAWLGSKLGLVKDVAQGAATSVYVATAPELEGVGGKYFSDSNEAEAKPYATDPQDAEKLWELSEKLTNLASHE